LAYCNDRNAYKADLAAWSRLGEKEISAIVQSPDLMGKTIYEVACEFKDYPASSQHLLQVGITATKTYNA
jgi:hypothetical protein